MEFMMDAEVPANSHAADTYIKQGKLSVEN